MAYATTLASVPFHLIEAFRMDTNVSLQASKTIRCSHLIAYWVQVQPLGRLLGQAIDGGQPLHAELWHPLNPPTCHEPVEVARLAKSLRQAWEAARAQADEPIPEDDWYEQQIKQVVELFDHAAANEEAIISFLLPPGDKERGNRVFTPKLT